IPSISKVSRSLMVTSLGSTHGNHLKYKDPLDSTMTWLNIVDENYLPLHGHKLVAGVPLHSRAEGAKESEVLVNEQVLKRFKIANGDAQKALGETVIVDANELTIVGVLKDFHYGTTEKGIEPVIFRYSRKPVGYVNILVSSTDLVGTMEKIEKVWKKVDQVHPMDARFYDDQIQEAYSQFSVMLKVIGFIAFLAICISSLGLFGMVVFTAETRLKEVTIRKVFGASEVKLVMLLSGGFLALLGIATLVALPTTWFFFQNVVLVNFAYHTPISLLQLLIGPAIVMLLSFIMIGSQTIKVAGTNPALILKNE
ncbi:MAG: FtsX-like permease family protein, partial [Chryseolinea sp.]